MTKDSIAGPTGSPLEPRPWQERLIRETFARNPDGRRRHRTAVWGMGRKNGKTGIVAPIALFGLMLEGAGAEVYSCAADRDQAKLVFGAARRTVELDEGLSGRLRLYRDAIEYPTTGSVYRALSSEAYTKEGLSPTLVIADELHAWPSRDLYDVMALAMGARRDPLMLIVTTAGIRTDSTGGDSIAYTLYQYGARVASGEVDDPSFYMAWWRAPDEAPIEDPVAWEAANPGLGDILDRDELAGQARRAISGGMAESEFRIKRLNCWVSSATAWLPAGLWEAHASPRRLEDGERVVLGFDGSYSGDSTGIVACALDGHLQVIGSWERPLDNPSWRVPVAEVIEAIRAACRRYSVVEVAMDPFRWARELQDLEAEGFPVIEYPTGSPSRMVPACAKFYDALGAGSGISHDGDPRLARHLANAILRIDAKGPRIVKEHRGSPRKIDLAVCAVIAYDRATWHAGGPAEKEPLIAWA